MFRYRAVITLLAVSLLMSSLLVSVVPVSADEGMWLYSNLPTNRLKKDFDFEPSREWAEHVMKSSVRFNSGGSGSFVSSSGLVITNHHVAADTLYKISSAEKNYHRDGFYARTRAEEIPAPDLELNQLIEIRDVTAEVNASVGPGVAPAAAFLARQAKMAEIEEAALSKLDKTKYRCDIVTLYRGGQYHLYTYKKYTDVRVVFAPEFSIAFFGGDPDNFEYPRYDLDITILRAYEDGKPANTENFFKWSPSGAAANELTFVSGHPGSTRRSFTSAAIEYQRDYGAPLRLERLYRMENVIQQYGNDSQEAYRRSKDDLFGVQNTRKAFLGRIAALQDPAFTNAKLASEKELLATIKKNAKLAPLAGAWDTIATAQTEARKLSKDYTLLEQGWGFNTAVFGIARNIVRMTAEDKLPSAQRLREYRDSARESLLQELYSEAPLYPDFELAKLTDSLGYMAEKLGGNHPLVKAVLAEKSPSARAAEIINGTKLFDVAARKELVAGGAAAVAASKDPLIKLAILVDEPSRAVRKQYEQLVEEPERKGYAQVADAMFAINGTNTYPDATFTLRLSYGAVKGYEEAGKEIPPFTTLGGAFEHEAAHGATDPWKLPKSWHDNKSKLNLDTPFNFVSTADIIGGNSGSPVFNKNAEWVGIIFDGNIQSLGADFSYSDAQSRAVSVHSAAITEVLRKIYDAGALVDEMGK